MSTITVDKNGILDVVAGLRALQAMTAEYEAFSVSFGQSRGRRPMALSESGYARGRACPGTGRAP